MLIKIDEDRYINSDHIVLMDPGTSDSKPSISMSSCALLYTTLSIIQYIAQILDAHDALTTGQPQEMSLQSRLAIHLRNQSAGQSLNMLATIFTDIDKYSIEAALNELDANNVVHALGVDEDRLFYHASNAIFSGPPEAF